MFYRERVKILEHYVQVSMELSKKTKLNHIIYVTKTLYFFELLKMAGFKEVVCLYKIKKIKDVLYNSGDESYSIYGETFEGKIILNTMFF